MTRGRRLLIPGHLLDSVDRYQKWDRDRDPSRFGALNLAAYIGERLEAIVAADSAKKKRRRR